MRQHTATGQALTLGCLVNMAHVVPSCSLGKRPEQIELFPGPTSSQPITTTAPASSPMGLHVRLPTSCPRCGIIIAFIAAGSGPHYASQRRIPPCGRGLSSSSWCEVEIVQGVWTCLACNSIAPGNITVPSSW
jgi:hypothetical protein